MKKTNICVIDLITNAPTRIFYDRILHANLASIMPQAIATWCEEEGYKVSFICYTGFENLIDEIPYGADIYFISAFSYSAQFAYALSNLLRSNGAITVLGGPHARSYPQDAMKYFDYVLGFTDKAIIRDVLQDRSQYRPMGVWLKARHHPEYLPGVQERWKFIQHILSKGLFIKIVPMLGSLGCPYNCSFCIDSVVPYQPLDLNTIKEDLRFLLLKFKRPAVVWHDPNFGIRFNDFMEAIEEAIPANSIDFIAECVMSLLTEPNLKRLKRNGFKAVLPGIESWNDTSNKSKCRNLKGMDKVCFISHQVNTTLRYIPFVQTNFIFGLDIDEGTEPYELTKRFVDMSPGAFPAYCLLTAFGQAVPLNLEFQRENRVLPFPFHFLSNRTLNVKPKNYSWIEFYDYLIDLSRYTFSYRAIIKRFKANNKGILRWIQVLRAFSGEGFGRIKYYSKVRRLLKTDKHVRRYFEQETTELPVFYVKQIEKDLGPLWEWLPKDAIYHDPNQYLKCTRDDMRTRADTISI
jgi:hypothetical protein